MLQEEASMGGVMAPDCLDVGRLSIAKCTANMASKQTCDTPRIAECHQPRSKDGGARGTRIPRTHHRAHFCYLS